MKNPILNALVELLKVKSIVTLTLIGTLAYSVVVSKIALSTEFYGGVMMTVITCYFTRKENKK